jgi:heme oxygenase
MLRAATIDLHAAVDARFSRGWNRDAKGYAAFLVALARVVIPLERALETAGVAKLLPDWADRRRSDALAEDLASLDEPLSPIHVEPLAGEAQMFGALYVLEGSRLGGKLLLKRALEHPDERVRAATRYLSHGADRNLWPSFVQRLDASAAVAEAPDDAVAAARWAFMLFGVP